MMILWEFRNIVAGKLVHRIHKPIVICVIDVFHAAKRFGLRVSQRGGAPAAGLLGDCKGNTLVKCAGKERHFAGIGAAGDGDVM